MPPYNLIDLISCSNFAESVSFSDAVLGWGQYMENPGKSAIEFLVWKTWKNTFLSKPGKTVI